ncbi:MAG: hypothetical protein R3D82_19995 [Xanthobacteraceae bacterium]|nr:hypothetical protein [Bradyrhizobium sp.]
MPNIVKLASYRASTPEPSVWSAEEVATKVFGMLSQLRGLKLESKAELRHMIVALDLANAVTQQLVKQVGSEPNRKAMLDWSSQIQALIETARNRAASL